MTTDPDDFPTGRPRDGRSAGRAAASQGDALSGPVDDARPANPWPRLFALALVLLGVLALTGLCVASFADPPAREVRVRSNEFTPGQPRPIPITQFGADPSGRTYGAYLAVEGDLRNAYGLLSVSPDSRCTLDWQGATSFEGTIGVYVDPCSDARYAFDGAALHTGATRDMHTIEARRDGTGYVLDFSEATLGSCRGDQPLDAPPCSTPSAPEVRRLPSGTLANDFGQH